MKKLLSLLVAFTLLFISCEEEEEEVNTSLEGTWLLTSKTENGEDIFNSCNENDIVIFDNGTFTSKYYLYTTTTNEMGEIVAYECSDEQVIIVGNYIINGNSITLRNDYLNDKIFTYSISGNILEKTFNESYTETLNDNETREVEIIKIFTYIKQ